MLLAWLSSTGCYDFSHLGKSVCETDSSALCDDFESGGLDPARWRMPGAGVTVDKQQAHAGSFALHAHTTGLQLAALATPRANFSPSPSLFLRGWFLLPADESTRLTGLAGAAGDIDVFANHGLVGASDTLGAAVPQRLTSNTSLPIGRWSCVEVEIDTAPQQTRVFVNGASVPELTAAQTTAGMPPLDTVSFGVSLSAPGRDVELFIDDVVVSTKGPVGCGP